MEDRVTIRVTLDLMVALRFFSSWVSIENASNAARVLKAIDEQDPSGDYFQRRFRDFAVRNLNDAVKLAEGGRLYRDFAGSGFPKDRPADLDAKPTPLGVVKLTQSVPAVKSLEAAYLEMTPIDYHVHRLVFDFSKLSRDVDVDVVYYTADQTTSLANWQRRRVSGGRLTFCRDVAAERVDDIILVFSNHSENPNSVAGGTYSVNGTALCPTAWIGAGRGTYQDGGLVSSFFTTGMEIEPNPSEVEIGSWGAGGQYEYITTGGSVTWKLAGTDANGCRVNAGGTFSFDRADMGSETFTSANVTVMANDPNTHRPSPSYSTSGGGIGTAKIVGTKRCPPDYQPALVAYSEPSWYGAEGQLPLPTQTQGGNDVLMPNTIVQGQGPGGTWSLTYVGKPLVLGPASSASPSPSPTGLPPSPFPVG